ncbi:MAG: twin-arginine translocase TatA/TatE family subunit [Magnetococcales bacterium]|nr:twin-arginine translocase TatA/TatE family subunit [Magnetococcales bacterium]MBF0157616.1 twin-arginine translocase TatA/TatE family subunit [Magnetococcales bacterium]
MFGLGWVEILVILVVALFAIGPDQIPEVARTLGKLARQAQRLLSEFRDTINLEEMESYNRQRHAAHQRESAAPAPSPLTTQTPPIAPPAEGAAPVAGKVAEEGTDPALTSSRPGPTPA